MQTSGAGSNRSTNWATTTVHSYLTGLDLTKQVKLLFIQHKQSSLVQTKNRKSAL